MWDGAPASKIMSGAGLAEIQFRTGPMIWQALSVLGVGIQGIGATTPRIQPDGVYVVSRTITSSTVPLAGSTWITLTMANGTATLTHGEMYAVVFNMTTRVSTDSAEFGSVAGYIGVGKGWPGGLLKDAAAWTNSGWNLIASMILKADDGTLGWFHRSIPITTTTAVSISSGGTNTEYGLRFVLPWTCQVDALGYAVRVSGSAADYSAILYSDPNGTPTTVTSIAMLSEHNLTTGPMVLHSLPLIQNVTITASTTYLLALKPSSATPITIQSWGVPSAAHKIAFIGGTGLAQGTRGGGVGAFSMDETLIPGGFGVSIHQINPTTTTVTTTTTITVTLAGAGGMLVHPGMTGGIKG